MKFSSGPLSPPLLIRWLQANPDFLKKRVAKFDAIAEKHKERLARKPKEGITIVLPDGTEKKGVSYETTPMDIAKVSFRCLGEGGRRRGRGLFGDTT